MGGEPGVFINWTETKWTLWLVSEIRSGRLRQGWGGPGTSMLSPQGHLRSYEDWSASYAAVSQKADPKDLTEEKIRTRYSILKTLLEPVEGDIILIPRFWNDQVFTTCNVTTGYEFDDSQFELHELDRYTHWSIADPDKGKPRADAGHVIKVDPVTIRHHKPAESEIAAQIAAKLAHHRTAINAVRDAEYANIIRRIHRKGG